MDDELPAKPFIKLLVLLAVLDDELELGAPRVPSPLELAELLESENESWVVNDGDPAPESEAVARERNPEPGDVSTAPEPASDSLNPLDPAVRDRSPAD
jgi:hypothetical protein